MWALEMVRRGFESCAVCSNAQQLWGLEQVSSLVVPSGLFPSFSPHHVPQYTPLLSSSSQLSLFSVLLPLSLSS